MTKPKTKRAPRSKTSKAPVFDGLTPAQAKAQIKKSIEEFRAANSQGHKMPPAAPTAAEDRVLSNVETLDDQAHDVVMELGRLLVEKGFTASTIHTHALFTQKKGKRNA